jgi:hypothetical protein
MHSATKEMKFIVALLAVALLWPAVAVAQPNNIPFGPNNINVAGTISKTSTGNSITLTGSGGGGGISFSTSGGIVLSGTILQTNLGNGLVATGGTLLNLGNLSTSYSSFGLGSISIMPSSVFVPYNGATSTLNLGSQNFITTGSVSLVGALVKAYSAGSYIYFAYSPQATLQASSGVLVIGDALGTGNGTGITINDNALTISLNDPHGFQSDRALFQTDGNGNLTIASSLNFQGTYGLSSSQVSIYSNSGATALGITSSALVTNWNANYLGGHASPYYAATSALSVFALSSSNYVLYNSSGTGSISTSGSGALGGLNVSGNANITLALTVSGASALDQGGSNGITTNGQGELDVGGNLSVGSPPYQWAGSPTLILTDSTGGFWQNGLGFSNATTATAWNPSSVNDSNGKPYWSTTANVGGGAGSPKVFYLYVDPSSTFAWDISGTLDRGVNLGALPQSLDGISWSYTPVATTYTATSNPAATLVNSTLLVWGPAILAGVGSGNVAFSNSAGIIVPMQTGGGIVLTTTGITTSGLQASGNYLTYNVSGTGNILTTGSESIAGPLAITRASSAGAAFTITSTANVPNLNASFLSGSAASAFSPIAGSTSITTLGTIATGTIPIANLGTMQGSTILGNTSASSVTPFAIGLGANLGFSGSNIAVTGLGTAAFTASSSFALASTAGNASYLFTTNNFTGSGSFTTTGTNGAIRGNTLATGGGTSGTIVNADGSIGFSASNTFGSVVIGNSATANGDNRSVIIGQAAAPNNGGYSVCLGWGSACGQYSTCVGENSEALYQSVGIGQNANATANYATAVGRNSATGGNYSASFGDAASDGGFPGCTVLGAGLTASTTGQVLIGGSNSGGTATTYLTMNPPGNATFAGSITSTHLIGGGSAPTIAAGTGAGTSPTVSIAGTDNAGTITVTTGTLPTGTNATVCTVTFSKAYVSAPYIVFCPSNSTAATLSGVTMVYPTTGTTSFTIVSGTTALTAASTYTWNYMISQ